MLFNWVKAVQQISSEKAQILFNRVNPVKNQKGQISITPGQEEIWKVVVCDYDIWYSTFFENTEPTTTARSMSVVSCQWSGPVG